MALDSISYPFITMIQFPVECLQKTCNTVSAVQEKISNCASKVFNTVYPKNPVTKHREVRMIPFWIDILVGKCLFYSMISVEGGYYNKRNYESIVNTIGNTIVRKCDLPDLPFESAVIDSNDVNAWCLPGAKIGFYKGLIERMDLEKDTFGVGNFSLEEKIAAVMGHEITHAAARHSSRDMELGFLISLVFKIVEVAFTNILTMKLEDKRIGNSRRAMEPLIELVNFVFSRINNFMNKLILFSMSRSKELEADKYGMVYMKRAGYDPRAAIWLQKFFAKENPKTKHKLVDRIINLLSTHPSSEERALQNEKTLQEINAKILV